MQNQESFRYLMANIKDLEASNKYTGHDSLPSIGKNLWDLDFLKRYIECSLLLSDITKYNIIEGYNDSNKIKIITRNYDLSSRYVINVFFRDSFKFKSFRRNSTLDELKDLHFDLVEYYICSDENIKELPNLVSVADFVYTFNEISAIFNIFFNNVCLKGSLSWVDLYDNSTFPLQYEIETYIEAILFCMGIYKYNIFRFDDSCSVYSQFLDTSFIFKINLPRRMPIYPGAIDVDLIDNENLGFDFYVNPFFNDLNIKNIFGNKLTVSDNLTNLFTI